MIKIEEPGIYKITGYVGETNLSPAQGLNQSSNGKLNISLTVTDNALSKKPFGFALFAGLVGGILSLTRSKSRAAVAASLGGRLAPAAKGRRKGKGKKKNKANKQRSNKKSKSQNKARNKRSGADKRREGNNKERSGRKQSADAHHKHREGGGR